MSSRCSHFELCGGCQFLDMPYPDQLDQKYKKLLAQFLEIWPDWQDKIRPILPCIEQEYFRNKMEFAFSVKGTEQNPEFGEVYLGLKKKGSFCHIIPITHCYLQSGITNKILAQTAAFFTRVALTTWNYHTHQGLLRYLAIRQSKTTGHFMVTLIVSEWQKLFHIWAEELALNFPEISGILVGIQPGRGDTAFSQDLRLLKGHAVLEETLDGLRFKLGPQSFFQTNTNQAKVLYRTIASFADLKPTDTVFDLYCGTGTIGLYLAKHAARIIGIDENPASIENAQENAQINNIHNAEFIAQNVKNFLKFDTTIPDVIVVDPPRDGLIPKALRRILEKNVPQLIYVSCNPKTLVRDLILLIEGGYSVTKIQPVDMFPHTGHVEMVVKLMRTKE